MLNECNPNFFLFLVDNHLNVENDQYLRRKEIARNQAMQEIRQQYGQGLLAPIKKAIMLKIGTDALIRYKLQTPVRMRENGRKFKALNAVEPGMYYLNPVL